MKKRFPAACAQPRGKAEPTTADSYATILTRRKTGASIPDISKYESVRRPTSEKSFFLLSETDPLGHVTHN